MRVGDTRGCGNLILDALPKRHLKRLWACGEEVDLVTHTALGGHSGPRACVHFPLEGLIAVLAEVGGHPPLEVALIGRESMEGAMTMFGSSTPASHSLVLMRGRALRLGVRHFSAQLDDCPPFRRLVSHAVGCLFSQTARAVPCTRFHSLPSRLALWLLRAQDRLGVPVLPFTHQRLAGLLGVQRSAVTLAAGQMHRVGVIRYARGRMMIIDRGRLEELACACYALEGYLRAPPR